MLTYHWSVWTNWANKYNQISWLCSLACFGLGIVDQDCIFCRVFFSFLNTHYSYAARVGPWWAIFSRIGTSYRVVSSNPTAQWVWYLCWVEQNLILEQSCNLVLWWILPILTVSNKPMTYLQWDKFKLLWYKWYLQYYTTSHTYSSKLQLLRNSFFRP